jgi:protein TonB
MTGWAALQARLGKSDLQAAVTQTDSQKNSQKKDSRKSELLSYNETPSYGKPLVSAAESASISQQVAIEKPKVVVHAAEEPVDPGVPEAQPASKRGRIFFLAIAAVFLVIAAIPQGRRGYAKLYRTSARAVTNWLNPPPVRLPQAVTQHDSLGQSGDEYKLPSVPNIPDATTDASQIRVLPVIDPTAKPDKNADANNPQAPTTSDNNPAASLSGQNANQAPANGQTQNVGAPVNSINVAATPGSPSSNLPNSNAQAPNVQPSDAQASVPAIPAHTPPRPVASPVRNYSAPATSAGGSAGIPSSLKSQLASSTPDASGAMPAEAAMSSIEPVSLPESAARALLTQAADPEYPASAKASGQRGSVVLQVLIARDGTVQDAKFLQGSLLFARAAIDAVKQWRFKPYSLNGRAVSVQSTVTLNFKPPA